MKPSWPVVFFGSGPVAAQTLEFVAGHLLVSAVISKPPKAHGHTSTPPVDSMAGRLGLKLYTPANKIELGELFQSEEIDNDLGLVVDYGLIIPQSVIDHFKKGIVNSHFSLLPLWRGADPITFPLLQGDKITGVSLMLINAAMDEGELLVQRPLDIAGQETGASLTEKLITLNNQLLAESLPRYMNGELQPHPQDKLVTPTYTRKLIKEDGLVDWSKTAEIIEREIRAYQPWPKSYCSLAGKDVTLLSCQVVSASGQPGEVFITDDKQLAVYCGEKALIISELVVAGKNKMSGQAFMNGYLRKKSK